MEQFTIRCTEEQTRKAFELGAPIEILPNYTEYGMFPFVKCTDGNERPCILPTAEQMLGWIEEQGLHIQISQSYKLYYHAWLFKGGFIVKDNNKHIHVNGNSYKETLLAAINITLDYLINSKK